MKKLAIVVSHPIQYYAPLFEVLAKNMELKVFYCSNPNADQIGRDGFGKSFKWDIDLLNGYDYEFLENISKNPSLSNKKGCDTPNVGDRLKKFGATHVVVFGWYLKSFIQTLDYCNKNKIPIAVRGDSQLDPTQVFYKRWIKKIYYPIFLKRFQKFLYVGERNKAYLKHYGVKDTDLIFSPHAVNQEFWKGEKKKSENFTFIWVAKFISLKRPFDLIEAFKQAIIIHPQLNLKMIGSGELLESCMKSASGIEQIQFLGFKNQKELKEEYLKSDALILNSSSETWGLVVNEAFANTIPVIISSVCGCVPDLVNDQTAILIKEGELNQLKEAILEMPHKINLNQKLIKQSIEEKNKIYSYERNVESFKSFLNT